ncbi:hypothetical protein AM587_10011385 [Phytophthora nicotianae]|uniref:RxLR effector protein n=1 Tax=Phytophthora nicotianae TaxID=4792 RepID=A0A0W8CXY0_PHYNI|nr:hypothetical protein AM587_10011385 [Phytophthora nicotianae]
MKISATAAFTAVAMFLLTTPSVAPPPPNNDYVDPNSSKIYSSSSLRRRRGLMTDQGQTAQSDSRIVAADGIEDTAASIDAVRSLRAEDVMTPSPLDAFKVAIAKFEKKPASRRLNSDEDEKEVIKKFTKAMEKMKKNGRA